MKYLFLLFMLFVGLVSYCQIENYQDEYEPTFPNGPGHLAYIRKLPYSKFCTKRLRDSVFARVFATVYGNLEYFVYRAHDDDVRFIVLRIADTKYKRLNRERTILVCDLERELLKRNGLRK